MRGRVVFGKGKTRMTSSGRLALAKAILFFIGMVTVFLSVFALRDAEDEVPFIYGDVPTATVSTATEGASASVPQVSEKEVEQIRQARQELTSRLKLAYGANVGVGVLFIGCALLVNRMPLIATVTGLTLYLATTALMAAVDPALLARGLAVRIVIVVALILAVNAAIRTERRRRAKRRYEEQFDVAANRDD